MGKFGIRQWWQYRPTTHPKIVPIAGQRVQKSLNTRTHSCSHCQVEICRDTNAAINILKKGMKILGLEWPDSTFGQKESASSEGKHGEKTTSTVDRQLETASGFL
jgi:putative transposase